MPSQPGSPEPLPNNNPSLSVLRNRLAHDQAREAELEQQSVGANIGTRFLSAENIQRVLRLRNRGVDSVTIEKQLKLKPGVVEKLGRKGLVDVVK
jgi:hypothetical protein